MIQKKSQESFVGLGEIKQLKHILNKHNPNNILLVTGKSSYNSSGAEKTIALNLSGHNVVHFNDFDTNPKIEHIEKGTFLVRKENPDLVIAVGGGSVLDFAKSINILAANPLSPLEYIQENKLLENAGKTLVAIPTTAGSGSEATKFAVVYIGKTKYSLESEAMLPNYAIVDAQFTFTLPPKISACTGMDALSQAIESYWSVNANSKSKSFASRSIQLIMNNLAKAVNDPTPDSRTAMVIASNLAGKAINISKTTACHAISYPITAYFKVPHGHAVALTLPKMLIYNSQDVNKHTKKTVGEIVSLLASKTQKQAYNNLNDLMQSIGLTTQLGQLGIKSEEDINIIVKNSFNPARVKNNPRLLTKEALNKMLNELV